MRVVVNGVARTIADGTSVADVVATLVADATGCAVALGDDVLPRRDWASRTLRDGDRLEVLTAVQGG